MNITAVLAHAATNIILGLILALAAVVLLPVSFIGAWAWIAACLLLVDLGARGINALGAEKDR